MGSYLGKPRPSPPPAEARADLAQTPVARRPCQALHQVHRVQHVHRAHPAPRLRPAARPRTWDPADPASWVVNEAWKRFPMKRPQNSIVGPLASDWWESYLKRTLWSLRHPRAVWSPVTVTITPRRGLPAKAPAQAIGLAGPSPPEKPPDPRARETVLRALRDSKKGRLRLEETPSPPPERLDGKRRSPDARPSAFKPLTGSGDLASFVPSLGPLGRSLGPWNSDHGLRRRPASSPASSSGSSHAGRPLRPKRNAITSSYSSSRDFSEPWKRNLLRSSFQMPEWPVKRKTGQQDHSAAPLASEGSGAASGSGGQQKEALPRPRCRPGTPLSLSPPPQLGDAVPAEDPALGMKAGLQWGSKTRQGTTEVTTGPPLSVTLECAGTAPTQGTHLQVASPGPLASLQWRGEETSVAHSSLKTASLLAPPLCSPSEPLPGPSWDEKPTAAVTLMTPASPASPVTVTTRRPPTRQADRSARPPDPPTVTSALPSTRRTLFATARKPAHRPSASAPPAATSADPSWKPVPGPPPTSETGDALPPRVSVTAAARSPPGISVPTFEPIFGGIEPLESVPVTAPSFKQASPPAPPACTHLCQDLVKAASVATSTAPRSTSKDSSFKPPLDLDVADVTGAVGDTYSVPSTSHTFPLGASRGFRASSSPGTGFSVPPAQHATIPVAHTASICSRLPPRAAQTSPGKSTANFKRKGSPLSASALITSGQPTLLSGISNPTSVVTAPLGSSSKPPFPLSPGATPQPAFGAAGEQKQGAAQPALGPGFSSSVFRNSAVASPTPSPAQPALSSPTQSAFVVLTPSVHAFHAPASIQPDAGSTPAGFPLGPAGATGFGGITETRQSAARGSVFGSTAPRPFAFGGLVTPMDCGESGVPNMSSKARVLSIGAMPSGTTHAVTPFGKGWSQNTQGLTSQGTPFASGRASISARKTMLGGPPTFPLAHSIPVPRPVKTGSSFGNPSPPAKGSVGRGSFKSSAPSFSIGAKPKTPKNREQGHSRRHHTHKK
ncbi:POM121-like protein 2 [Phyllostomus discolor]|uniref:POM121-like protein 2 n=1 Tax=Phyllostomus discolor TaxID=89673 RepID=A0A6J2L114_9CHIR|nr:POM121-like protein 2 [Phyllostomus discolor]